jgi:hypothetical protein
MLSSTLIEGLNSPPQKQFRSLHSEAGASQKEDTSATGDQRPASWSRTRLDRAFPPASRKRPLEML